jgi:hypothetical protein
VALIEKALAVVLETDGTFSVVQAGDDRLVATSLEGVAKS